MMGVALIQKISYYLSEHPSIINFRWSPSQSYASTWSFLFCSISIYILLSLTFHLFLSLLPKRGPIPLGPIPALHSLTIAVISSVILLGTLISTAAEIRDTKWFWRRSKTPLQWLLCFPLGTRPSGRVFFWSYIYYLTRYLHLLRTFFFLLRHRRLPRHYMINHTFIIFMSFLWLEFSQSFQVVAIVFTTLISSVVYGYRFWTAVGLPSACFNFVLNCQFLLLGVNLICHVAVFLLHFNYGGCNGFRALGFNSILNCAILLIFLNYYLRDRKKILRLGSESEVTD